jgi:HAD superfamily hydrolase (TIGR01484 family)
MQAGGRRSVLGNNGRRERIVFSDIDYTIVFDSKLHDRTAALIEEVRRHAHFVLVTARSHEECLPLPPIPNDGLVTENGAAVYMGGASAEPADWTPAALETLRLDDAWDRRMAVRQETLDVFKAELMAEGWVMHHKLRAFSSSVTKSGKSEADIRGVLDRVPEGLQLQFSRNTAGAYLEVFPIEAGKDKAVFRVCEDLGVAAAQTFGMGDNANDLDMLRVVGFPLAPGCCHPDVRVAVLGRGGYVSGREGHEGAQDVLMQVLARL